MLLLYITLRANEASRYLLVFVMMLNFQKIWRLRKFAELGNAALNFEKVGDQWCMVFAGTPTGKYGSGWCPLGENAAKWSPLGRNGSGWCPLGKMTQNDAYWENATG